MATTNQSAIEVMSLTTAVDGCAALVHPLTTRDEREVLDFLAERPLHTVFMSGMIHDNGIVNDLNRGTFYGYRDKCGKLEGVALIGHISFIEARTERALAAFARHARRCEHIRVIAGEHDKAADFWNVYNAAGEVAHSTYREHLLEQQLPVENFERVTALRLATLDDLDLVMNAHAEVAVMETGINPMQTDPFGFRLRTARRIEQGRVWVWIEDGRLIFKADVVSETTEVAYIEGVYVAPEERGKSYGSRCMMQMGLNLLARFVSISLLVNETNEAALKLYQKAGFHFRSYYDTIYLHRAKNN